MISWIKITPLKWGAYCLISILFLLSVLVLIAWPKSTLVSYQPSVLLLDANEAFLAQYESTYNNESIGFGYWFHDQLPKRFVDATLALEDRDFYTHIGVDFSAIVRALWQNIKNADRISGASTITMQVVRGQHPAKRNYWNKLIEAVAAIIMTSRYGRDLVLDQYLKIVPYSNQIHGAQYASRKYFNKTTDDLSWAQIAFLAAIPQNPTRMNPLKFTTRQRAIKRGQAILLYLNQQKLIDQVQYDLAMIQINEILPPNASVRPSVAMHAILHVEQLLKKGELELSPLKQKQPLLISSFDLSMQQKLEDTSKQYINWFRAKGASNVAMIVLDQADLEVKAWLGSNDYSEDEHLGKIDFTQIKRSPGSTLKPHIYAMALDQKVITPSTVMDDLPNSETLIRNADYQFLGPMLPRQALSNSRNVPVVNLTNQLGLSQVYSFLSDLKLHNNEQSPSHFGNAIAIGSMPVTLEELINSYSVYSQDGYYQPLKWFKWQKTKQQEVLSDQAGDLISLFLSDPQARLPTFPRMGTSEYPYDVAVKTGTSQHFKDAWTVAYSKKYIVATWVGNANMTGMDDLTGSGSAAVLAKEVLLSLQQKQSALDQFNPPKGYESVLLCSVSGLLASEHCPTKAQEWMSPSDIPQEWDHSFEKVSNPDASFTLKVNLPPRYDLWLSSHKQFSDLKQVDQSLDTFLSDQTQIVFDVKQPKKQSTLIMNPEMPKSMQFTQFKVQVTPRLEQLVWYVNSKVYKTVSFPYTINFELIPGDYDIQVGVPNSPERSEIRKIRIIN